MARSAAGSALGAHGARAGGHRVRGPRTEAIRRMELDDFPVWVVNDSEGRDFYAETIKPWRKNDVLPDALRIPPTSGRARTVGVDAPVPPRGQAHLMNFFTNWREYDAPASTKLRLTVRNRFRDVLAGAVLRAPRRTGLLTTPSREPGRGSEHSHPADLLLLRPLRMIRAVPPLGVKTVSCPSGTGSVWTDSSPCITSRISPSRVGVPTVSDSSRCGLRPLRSCRPSTLTTSPPL